MGIGVLAWALLLLGASCWRLGDFEDDAGYGLSLEMLARDIASETRSSLESIVKTLEPRPVPPVMLALAEVPEWMDALLVMLGRTGLVGAVELSLEEEACELEGEFFIDSLGLESEILDMWKPSLSMIGEVPRKEPEGDGRGWDPVMKMPSPRGVWVPPRPCEGGTPTSLVGTAAGVVASSAWTTASTSSMHISTFSGFKSVWMICLGSSEVRALVPVAGSEDRGQAVPLQQGMRGTDNSRHNTDGCSLAQEGLVSRSA